MPYDLDLHGKMAARQRLVHEAFMKKREDFIASTSPDNLNGSEILKAETNQLGGRLAEVEHWLQELFPDRPAPGVDDLLNNRGQIILEKAGP